MTKMNENSTIPEKPNGKAEEIKSKKINELNNSQENNEIKSW